MYEVAIGRAVYTNTEGNPGQVHDVASRLRDREVIKLIFKSRYTTLAESPTDIRHGAGMSLVRRYIHEAGGKIALASLAGHETRFKIILPAAADSQAA